MVHLPSALSNSSSTPASTLRNSIFSAAKKSALAATALLLAALPATPAHGAGVISVDIFSGYDMSNAPTGAAYTGFSGHLDLDANAFGGAGYDFGQPFGLNTFAAVVSFSMYMSTGGFYIGGLNSGSSPVLWTESGGLNPFFGGPWAIGAAYNEVYFAEGFHDFEAIFLAGDSGSFGQDTGGSPFKLSLEYFRPWGGDPRVIDGAFSYVVPAMDAPLHVRLPSVPDSVGTLGAFAAALLVVFGMKRRLLAPALSPSVS